MSSDGEPDADASAVHPTTESIFGESEPPDAAPQVIAAGSHAASHPFWDGRGASGRRAGAARRGRGGTRGRGGGGGGLGAGSGDTDAASHAAAAAAAAANPINALIVDPEISQPAFTGISLRELEFMRRRNADGAESSVASEDEEALRRRDRRRQKRQRDDGDAHGGDEDRMAAAAFGCAGGATRDDDAPASTRKRPRTRQDEDEDEEEGESEEDDDDGDGLTESSYAQHCTSFPIRGERCIGCVYDRAVVGRIDSFVREHCTSMTPSALFRAAALHWEREVVAPRKAEGVRVPRWHWKDLESHYELHTVDPVLTRTVCVRSLNGMRSFHEQSLLRVNGDGTKNLDAKGADLMIKLVDRIDKQLGALDSARMPPPAARGAR